MSIDYRERRLRFWCQKVLPLVYDESLSYYELLCKIMKHLNEAETDVSALEEWLAALDAEAVKQVYSEFPLRASKDGNVLTLSKRYSANDTPVTSVEPADGSPITATGTTISATGHLDPDDENSPMGTVSIQKDVKLDISEATSSSKGAMSATDKSKLDALHEVTVVGGSSGNILVGSATTGYNRRYTVELNPNFQINIQNDYLVGDWEWNCNMRGTSSSTYFSSGNNVVVNTSNLSQQVDITSTRGRLALNGTCAKALHGEAGGGQIIGYSWGAASYYPFATVDGVSTVVSGETYYTVTSDIDIKMQATGTNVGNRDYIIYLFPAYTTSGTNDPLSNPYLTSEDRYFPSYATPFIPAKYVAHADANGFFSVTIPAGLTSKAIDTASTATPNQSGVYNIVVMCDGSPADLKDQVNIDYMKIAVKSHLI